MPFTVTKDIAFDKVDRVTGLKVGESVETMQVTYTVTKVEINANESLAFYEASYAGSDEKGTSYLTFSYSGEGNPVAEAENALREYIA